MNDNELDDMLNQWDAPPVRAALRKRVQAGLEAKGFEAKKIAPRRRFRWPSWHIGRGLVAGVAAGAVTLLLVVGAASPQSLSSGPIPYTVDLQYVDHNEDGSTAVTEYATTFLRDGHEWILRASIPNSALMTAHLQIANSLHLMLYSLARPFMDMGDSEKVSAQWIQRGCLWWGDKGSRQKLIGHETILNHETSIIQSAEGDWRDTRWLAPDLGCMTLKTTAEQLGSSGSYRLVSERLPLKVNMNR